MDTRSLEKYNEWKKRVKSKPLLNSLEKMAGNEEAIQNAFYKDLEFGTGGMRGIIGVGTNCLNIYNIRKVTQGVANTMIEQGLASVAISYDSRMKSREFAQCTAAVFAENGIKVHIVNELAPTPFLSFAVRRLSCDMGVMITASHNPKQYNGYKLYNKTGCQVLDDESEIIIKNINNVDPFDVKVKSFTTYFKKGLISYIPTWVTGAFLDEVEQQSINEAKPIKIVYTPLNGAGYSQVPKILYERGFKNITVVESQAFPSGSFATCKSPNPEKAETLALAVKLAKSEDADLVLATDPDCDRVGIAVKHEGEYVLMTGNEVGALLTDYILGTKYARWELPEDGVIVRTIVTTSLVDKIAAKYGVRVEQCLTGFKYIGDIINKLGESGDDDKFVFGFEESYGYLAGTHCRDKDAVVASMLIAEMAAEYLSQGKTLVRQLEIIYSHHGKYQHKNFSKTFEGASGNAKMRELLNNLRQNPLTSLAGGNIVKFVDFLNQNEYNVPKADVVQYFTDNGLEVIVRPSGTEPLIKFYVTASKSDVENKKLIKSVMADIDEIFK